MNAQKIAHAKQQRFDHEARTYLAVPFAERQEAYDAGARWDDVTNCWYAPAHADLAKLERWHSKRVEVSPSPATHPRDEFAAALREMGCIVTDEHPVMDGKTHRIATEGDRRGEKAGFYVAYLDGHPAGYAMNHRTGAERRWKAMGDHVDPAARAKLQAEAAAKQHQRAIELARSNEETAKRLEQQLGRLTPVTFPTPYMQAKGIGAHPGVYTDAEGKTYVPATDAAGKLWTIQFIDAEGTKRFAKASRKHGCFHAIGGLARLASCDVLMIAEGYATAASVSELLGKPAVAAFDAGNLLPVAQALQDKHPHKPILIVGDDDQAREQQHGVNPGREKAQQAANAVGGRVVLPIFAPREPWDHRNALSDFNDLAVRSVLGRDGAARQLRHAYEQALRDNARRRVASTEERRPRESRKSGRSL